LGHASPYKTSYIEHFIRFSIEAYKKAGYGNSEIAKDLGVHPSTIGRELKRNMTNAESPNYLLIKRSSSILPIRVLIIT
jgi:IS30 family transposase